MKCIVKKEGIGGERKIKDEMNVDEKLKREKNEI